MKTFPPIKMTLIHCQKTSGNNYLVTCCHIPKEQIPELLFITEDKYMLYSTYLMTVFVGFSKRNFIFL